jgi:hypothetical protein
MQEKMVAVVEPLIALEKRLMMAWRTTTTFLYLRKLLHFIFEFPPH